MISIVIPVFNEEEAIRSTLDRLRSALSTVALPPEIVVVDDGSNDGTSRILSAVPDIRVLRHGETRGYGAALKTGIRASTGEHIGILDGDGSYPPEAFPRLLAALTEGVEMVVGVRTGPRTAFPLLRRPGKVIVSWLANFLVGRKIPDLNSGMRVMRRDLVEQFFHLFPDGFSFTTTLTLAALTNRLGVRWVPIPYAPRIGRSKITVGRGLFREFPNFLALIVRMVTYFRPLRFFGVFSLLFLVLGLINLVRTLVLERNVSDASILLIVVGIQIGFLGLIADLIVRSRGT